MILLDVARIPRALEGLMATTATKRKAAPKKTAARKPAKNTARRKTARR